MEVTKTPTPARVQNILGRRYNSITRRVETDPKKIIKYKQKLLDLLDKSHATKDEIESLHGSLNYVADVEPFGRPFLAALSKVCTRRTQKESILIPDEVRHGLFIWNRILNRNKGIAMDFVLNRLPKATSNIWVDASTSWGIGGCCGPLYFKVPWNKLNQITTKTIAQKELLATIAALFTFNDKIRGSMAKLYTDNSNVFN